MELYMKQNIELYYYVYMCIYICTYIFGFPFLVDLMMENDGKDDEKVCVVNTFKPKINVGIDFGTDGTAIAYSFPGGKDVYLYGKWRVFGKRGAKKANKTRTAILLDKDGKFKAFGAKAVRAYVHLCM